MDRYLLRGVANWLNLSTPLGLAVARLGHADLRLVERRVYLATGYRLGFPVAGAFTVGSVVLTRHDRAWVEARPLLLAHEERHCWQYAACLGLPFLPLYGVATTWSKLRCGDRAARNVFERWAGLADGGYVATPRRSPRVGGAAAPE
jgi:hypothetical protein